MQKVDIPRQFDRIIWNHHCNHSPKREITRHRFWEISQNNPGFWIAGAWHTCVIWKILKRIATKLIFPPFVKMSESIIGLQDVLIFRVLLYCSLPAAIPWTFIFSSSFQFLELIVYLHIYAWALFGLENVPKYSCVCGLDTFWGIASRVTNSKWPQQ